MILILQFESGGEMPLEMHDGQYIPPVFTFTTPEGATFCWAWIDELPSGKQVFREVTQDEARRIFQEET